MDPSDTSDTHAVDFPIEDLRPPTTAEPSESQPDRRKHKRFGKFLGITVVIATAAALGWRFPPYAPIALATVISLWQLVYKDWDNYKPPWARWVLVGVQIFSLVYGFLNQYQQQRERRDIENRLLESSSVAAFPLHGAVQADVSISFSGAQPSTKPYAEQLRKLAFPNGKQVYGHIRVSELDPKAPVQAELARFVNDMSVELMFCVRADCDFAGISIGPVAGAYKHDGKQGVELLAQVPLGNSPLSTPVAPIRFGDRMQMDYDVAKNHFHLYLHSTPLEFVQLLSAPHDSEGLAGKYLFVAITRHPELEMVVEVVEQIALRRSDNRWLELESLKPIHRSGSHLFVFGQLKRRWM